jgi:hypothetical protein
MDDAGLKTYQPKMFTSEPWYSTTPLVGTSWFIKHFLPVGTPEYPFGAVFGGDPGSYKTTALAALLASLATGIPFLGRKAKGPCETYPFTGMEINCGAFEGPQSTANHSKTEFCGGSSGGRVEGQGSPEEEVDRMMRQLPKSW